MSLNLRSVPGPRWQSRLVLFLIVAFAAGSIGLQCGALYSAASSVILLAIVLGALLAFFAWKVRAATFAAAVAGGLITAALYLATPGFHTALWPLLALLLLTLAATRFGRAHKQVLGVAENPTGRNAAQVCANLGPAVLAGFVLALTRLSSPPVAFKADALLMALAAALGESAADTLSSEFGEVLGGEPRLLTTFRRVPAGTDGAVSMEGTVVGLAAAGIVAAVASLAFGLEPRRGAIVALAAVAGLFVDSVLGAALERRGWLNNDAVNFLSGLAAAILAAIAGVWL